MYKRLQMLCKEKGTNITHLCENVTGSSGNLSTWKKGYMRSDYLAKAADILECSTDYILGRTDNPNTTNSINNLHTTVNGTQANVINNQELLSEPIDEMTTELLKAFKSLSFKDKLEIMNAIMKKSEK